MSSGPFFYERSFTPKVKIIASTIGNCASSGEIITKMKIYSEQMIKLNDFSIVNILIIMWIDEGFN